MGRRTDCDNIIRRSRSGVRKPNDDTFPIVAMAEPGGWLVFREVPRVQEGVVIAICSTSHVDLAGTAAAIAIR
jgi:hypothetical protein